MLDSDSYRFIKNYLVHNQNLISKLEIEKINENFHNLKLLD